ncbi:bifunctional chorismate mutase/prephenate dehydratase [Aminicella lysinilytica]|uniref:Bifunctional chorismate mutase/prephenate dehydratase n=1 Tax=Aminicella lysinilytica TaxID=433323 RepID=A0A4R6Q8G3_9FIRM|nr:bifunctional chorismate mutase/prephenate dehydratase [Aminicella lysinilytica]TDP58415.1 monofunctional chorismate mutase [Aminicella lysinilytica]
MDIKDIRKKIDGVDAEIVRLFQERMKLSGEIAAYKKDNELPIKDEARETAKLEEIAKMADEDMATYCRMLYNNIMEMSRDYQRRVIQRGVNMLGVLEEAYEKTPAMPPDNESIACHGEQEPYCRQACVKFFGNDDHIQYFDDLEDIFAAVESGQCKYAVITIGRHIDVSNRVYEMLAENNCYIVRSTVTAGGMRFVCISRELEIYRGADRTCLMLRVPDVPGALYGVLDKFYALGLNVSKMKSWTAPDDEEDLMFCFDVETPFDSDSFRNMISQVSHAEQEYVYLGSYMEMTNE